MQWTNLLQRSITGFAKAAAIPYYRGKLRRFEATLARAHEVQREALFRKLRHCADSRFGRDHHFASIRTLDDFRKNVPITQYEYLAPYIKEVSEGKIEALFPRDEKIIAFACTSGTTKEPKLNPVTDTWLREYRRGWEIWGVKAIVEHAEMIGTRLLQVTGPATLDRTPSGLSVGMVSAIAVRQQNRVLRSFYATPCDVSEIHDPLAKYYTVARLAIAQRVGFVVGITPNNLIRLAETGNEHRQSLIRDIHDGTLRGDLQIPKEIRDILARRIAVKRPERARELERIAERTGTLYPKDYWPLSLISCWLGGTIGYQSRDLPRYYGKAPARDLGLVSTEGRHTIPLNDFQPEGVLSVDANYYEFVPAEERESTNPTVLECHELEEGRQYNIIMSTSSGLYRYDIGDVVLCRGYMGQAPVLEFLHKNDQCADMEGEKISGHQIASAVEAAARELALNVNCFTAVPMRQERETPYYALLVEQGAIEDIATARKFLSIVDRELSNQNVMYAGKRTDHYINAPRLVRLPSGTWSEYVETQTKSRTGDSQYKHPTLVQDSNWLKNFTEFDTVSVDANAAGTRDTNPTR